MFVYELSGSGFESSCSHLNFRFRACFQQGVLRHSGNYRVWIHSETRKWHDKNIQLKAITQNLFTWFAQNEMKSNINECNLLLRTTDAFNFEKSETKNLLGVTFDKKLKSEKHIITICQRANRKLNALAGLTPYVELGKRRMLTNAFFSV